MERQLSIHHQDDGYYVIFHNYMGPWEGRRIGEYLELEEIKPPDADVEPGPSHLKTGQFFMWHSMDRHPDIFAKIPDEKAVLISKAVEHFHVSVTSGQDMLPEIPQDQRELHNSESYVAYIEEQHRTAWERGPRAVVGAVALRAIPALFVIWALVILSRHMGDPYQDAGLDHVFQRSELPAHTQSAIGQFLNPDTSDRLRYRITAVRYMAGDRLILADGNYLRFRGLSEVEPVMLHARDNFAAPMVYVRASDGVVQVDYIDCAGERFAEGIVLERIAKFPPSDEEPLRSSTGVSRSFVLAEPPGLTDDGIIDGLLDAKASLEGILELRDGLGVVLTLPTGTGVVLEPSYDYAPMQDLLTAFADGASPVQADLVLVEKFPRRSRDRSASQTSTGLIGRAELYSLSVDHYNLVARR